MFVNDPGSFGIPWILMCFVAEFIMFPVALFLTLVFRCQKEEKGDDTFKTVTRKGYGLWTGLGLLVTFIIFILCLVFCY